MGDVEDNWGRNWGVKKLRDEVISDNFGALASSKKDEYLAMLDKNIKSMSAGS